MICSIKVLLCQDSRRIGHKSAETGDHDLKLILPNEPVPSQERFSVARGEGNLLHCSNRFRKEVIGRITDVCRRVYLVLAPGSLGGLHGADREGKERG
jgi:hypothetical protein